MTVEELIGFCNDNFDEKRRKVADVRIVQDSGTDWLSLGIDSINVSDLKAGVRGLEIHI